MPPCSSWFMTFTVARNNVVFSASAGGASDLVPADSTRDDTARTDSRSNQTGQNLGIGCSLPTSRRNHHVCCSCNVRLYAINPLVTPQLHFPPLWSLARLTIPAAFSGTSRESPIPKFQHQLRQKHPDQSEYSDKRKRIRDAELGCQERSWDCYHRLWLL